jgi:hypothetical protein
MIDGSWNACHSLGTSSFVPGKNPTLLEDTFLNMTAKCDSFASEGKNPASRERELLWEVDPKTSLTRSPGNSFESLY